MWCHAINNVATDFRRSLLGVKPSCDLHSLLSDPSTAQLLQNLPLTQYVFYSPYSCGTELCLSLPSFSHCRYFVLQGLSRHLLLLLYRQPWQSPPTTFQLPSAVLRSSTTSLFVTVLCLTIFLLSRLFLFSISFFSQHVLFLLDFSRVWFCNILRTFDSSWLLWNMKRSALRVTDPFSVHRLCTCKPSMSLSCYTVRMCSSLDIPGVCFDSKYFNETISLLFCFLSFFLFYFIFLRV